MIEEQRDNSWIPISERRPLEDEVVELLCVWKGHEPYIQKGFVYPEGEEVDPDYSAWHFTGEMLTDYGMEALSEELDATHWRLLPEDLNMRNEQIAWLIERRDRGTLEYLSFLECSPEMWTEDVNLSLKFADKKTADTIMGAITDPLESYEMHVCEHCWPDGGGFQNETSS